MRRPLFAVCLGIVAAAALWLSSGANSNGTGRQNLKMLPADGEYITVTGEVYHKDTVGTVPATFKIDSVTQSITLSVADSRQRIPMKNLICETETLKNIYLGSEVTLQGIFESFSEAGNPGEFDAAKYYDSQGICGRLTDITVVAVGEEYSVVDELLYEIRNYFKERLYQVFPEKEASILAAMLLGDKEELNRETKELYMDSGIIHILSISGLHITMIGMGIYRILRRMGMPVWIAAALGGTALLVYGIMTGMSVSACRAIGMYLLRMLSIIVGRTYDMLTALGVMAVILVVSNPLSLTSAGFLLSFGSVLGIGLLYPLLLPHEHSKSRGVIQNFLPGISITLFTLPIQLWFYYEIPVYSILLNFLVLPFMSLVLVTGLGAMLVPGAGMVGTVTCLILQGYEWLCNLFARLPFHTWNPGRPNVWQVVVYYAVLGILMILCTGKTGVIKKNNVRYLIISVLLTVSVMIITISVPVGNRVTFLDVGQGDGILVETSKGQVYLFDCGSTDRRQVGKYVLMPYLKYRGIRHVDAVFVSHGDSDHCNGIEELLQWGAEEGITIGELVLPEIFQEMRREEFADLLSEADKESEEPVPVVYISEGDSFVKGDFALQCLHPPIEYATGDSNAYSLCFYVEFGAVGKKASLLLTGDVQKEGEELLIQELKDRGIDSVTVLKVAHHGSQNSTSEAFLNQIAPKLAVISCGRDNPYGHPHEETLRRLEEVGGTVMSTTEYGAIFVEFGQQIEVRGWRHPD